MIRLCQLIETSKINLVFVGGSTVNTNDFNSCMKTLKGNLSKKLIIFPGSPNQISEEADAILLLSLISGRNPDYLIGHHVFAAPVLDTMDIQILPTGYILVDGGTTSSVAYVSQTTPIPQDKVNIVVNTALAGTQLGLQQIFIDAGSGAQDHVSTQIMDAVKKRCAVPLIVGGGFRDISSIKNAFEAGANVVVIGNKIEEDVDFMLDLMTLQSNHCKA